MGPYVRHALQAPVQDVPIAGTSMAAGIVLVSLMSTYNYVTHIDHYCCKCSNLLIALLVCFDSLQDVMIPSTV